MTRHSLAARIRDNMGVGAERDARRPISRVLSPRRIAGDDHSSGTPVTECLARPTRTAARKRACRPAVKRIRLAAPTWSCSRWGLPCHPRYRGRGALLPHPFTLTRGPQSGAAGGLLSVALSLGSPPPDVIRHRVSVEPGLSSPRPVARNGRRPSGRLARDKVGSSGASLKPRRGRRARRAWPRYRDRSRRRRARAGSGAGRR